MFSIASSAAVAVLLASGQQYAPPPSDSGPQRVAPRGSYAQSCTGSYVNQGRLYADCRDRNGRVRGTSIELNRCSSSDIGNDNGLLVCYGHRGSYEDNNNNRPGRPGDNDNRPGRPGQGGGWGNNRTSITVYRDADYRGASMTFRDEVANLQSSGFNDAISSMRFQGRWEACTDAYFRGQCQVFEDDVRNLSRWGMNDRISSLRPVRGGRW